MDWRFLRTMDNWVVFQRLVNGEWITHHSFPAHPDVIKAWEEEDLQRNRESDSLVALRY